MSELSCGCGTRFIGRNETLDLSLYLKLKAEKAGNSHSHSHSRTRTRVSSLFSKISCASKEAAPAHFGAGLQCHGSQARPTHGDDAKHAGRRGASHDGDRIGRKHSQ